MFAYMLRSNNVCTAICLLNRIPAASGGDFFKHFFLEEYVAKPIDFFVKNLGIL